LENPFTVSERSNEGQTGLLQNKTNELNIDLTVVITAVDFFVFICLLLS